MKLAFNVVAGFLSLSSAASTILAADSGIGPSFKGPVGVQLYSLRAEFNKDVPAALDRLRDFGIKNVELHTTYGIAPEKFRELLQARGLTAVSSHFQFDRLRTDIEGVARDAKALGVTYVGCAWIAHQDTFDEQDCRTAIEVFNAAGAALAKHSLQFFYHNHGYEFRPHGDGTFMDLLMKETRPELVKFQMDVFWVMHPGHDPVAWLKKYPGRWVSFHLKDMKKGTPTGEFTGKSDVNNNVVLGTGMTDWPAVLREAANQGVKYYFIEDESDAVAQQIPQTLKFLEQVKF